MRVFRPLKSDHPAIGTACSRCGYPIREGERVCLIPKFETQEGFNVEAALSHATCALAGLKTQAGTIKRIKDGDGSPYPVELIDNRQATLAECGLGE